MSRIPITETYSDSWDNPPHQNDGQIIEIRRKSWEASDNVLYECNWLNVHMYVEKCNYKQKEWHPANKPLKLTLQNKYANRGAVVEFLF